MLCSEEVPHRQNWFKGTTDAVRHNLDHLESGLVDYFLILQVIRL